MKGGKKHVEEKGGKGGRGKRLWQRVADEEGVKECFVTFLLMWK